MSRVSSSSVSYNLRDRDQSDEIKANFFSDVFIYRGGVTRKKRADIMRDNMNVSRFSSS